MDYFNRKNKGNILDASKKVDYFGRKTKGNVFDCIEKGVILVVTPKEMFR